MRVVGRLKQDRWAGPEGQARSKVQIVAEHVEFKPQFKKDGRRMLGMRSLREAQGMGTPTSVTEKDVGTRAQPA